MERTLAFDALKNEFCLSEIIECHKQSWSKKSWLGYENSPRFADGILIIYSL